MSDPVWLKKRSDADRALYFEGQTHSLMISLRECQKERDRLQDDYKKLTTEKLFLADHLARENEDLRAEVGRLRDVLERAYNSHSYASMRKEIHAALSQTAEQKGGEG